MKKIILILTSLILLTFMASAIPYPHAFYGTVTYSNGSQITGLTLTAVLGSFQDTSQITNSQYGQDQDTLIVESENEGGLILFYLPNIQEPIGNHTFKKFEITELNFIIPTTANQNNTPQINPLPSSSSSSSSSSGGGGGGGSSSSSRSNPIIQKNITREIEVLNPLSSDKKNTNEKEIFSNLNQAQNKNAGITGAIIGENIKKALLPSLFILTIIALISIFLLLRKKQ